MSEHFETVIIGGGQFGLAASYCLSQQGRNHIVLDGASRIGSAWRSRWDSLTLVTPNWTARLPGMDYDGPDPDGFMTRDEIADYLEGYARRYHLPVRCNTRVRSVELRDSGGYMVTHANGVMTATNIVVATGFENRPNIPNISRNLPEGITQMHSSAYRNPGALPEGAVLVVGTGQSGAQIAEELHMSGRRVYLCVSGAGRAPRRYRGKDGIWWLTNMGFFEHTMETFPMPLDTFTVPHLSGTNGGHTISLHLLARDGITLLGKLQDVRDGTLTFAPDLKENLARGDGFEATMTKMVDGYIARAEIDVPEEVLPTYRDGFDAAEIERLNLHEAGIRAVIWATGYTGDYSMIKLPVLNEFGMPNAERGVSPYPGLYFLGIPFQPTLKSGMWLGVAESAEHVARHIVEHYQPQAISAG